MKLISNFLKFIGNIFDKLIIMPITRLIYKISKGTKKPKKTLETMLTKSSSLLFISILIEYPSNGLSFGFEKGSFFEYSIFIAGFPFLSEQLSSHIKFK